MTAAQKEELESLWWLGVFDDPFEYIALSDEARQIVDILDDRFQNRVDQILTHLIPVDVDDSII